MKLNLQDGGRFEGQNADDLVRQIWRSAKFDDSKTVEEYMVGFAERSLLYDGKTVNTTDCESFLKSLVETGFAELTN